MCSSEISDPVPDRIFSEDPAGTGMLLFIISSVV